MPVSRPHRPEFEHAAREIINSDKTHKTITKKAFFLNVKELSNKHIVERGIATGLIKDGESAKDVAQKLRTYNYRLGDFLDKVIEQNTSRKRGGTKKNAYVTGKHPFLGDMIKNPEEYLKVISEYIIDQINSRENLEGHQEYVETIKTLFGVMQDTKKALADVFRM